MKAKGFHFLKIEPHAVVVRPSRIKPKPDAYRARGTNSTGTRPPGAVTMRLDGYKYRLVWKSGK
jgi:hypothetical protein